MHRNPILSNAIEVFWFSKNLNHLLLSWNMIQYLANISQTAIHHSSVHCPSYKNLDLSMSTYNIPIHKLKPNKVVCCVSSFIKRWFSFKKKKIHRKKQKTGIHFYFQAKVKENYFFSININSIDIVMIWELFTLDNGFVNSQCHKEQYKSTR